MQLIEVLRRATDFLGRHESSSPRLDAELLLAHALGIRRLDLYLQHEREMGDDELARYRELTRRRGEGQPVAYLTGHREFMTLDFEVTPDVLVPNPDTEVLVQRAVAWARERGGEVRIADVGTGSGCIAVSLAHFLPEATVHASDVDAAALKVAERNAVRHNVRDRVHFEQSDLLDKVPRQLHAVVANLPYLANDLRLQMEVEAQPAVALYGGPAGGELVARLLADAPSHLQPGGAVLTEIDPVILPDLLPIAERTYAGHRVHRDLGGHERVLEAWL